MTEHQTGNGDDAIWLDGLLAGANEQAAPKVLERRVLADFDRIAARPSPARTMRRIADAIWPGVPAWQPACALALALLVGAGVASLAPVEMAQQDELGSVFAFDGQPELNAQDI